MPRETSMAAPVSFIRWLAPDPRQERLIPNGVLLGRVEPRLRKLGDQQINVLEITPARHFPEPLVRPLLFPKELELLDQNLLPTQPDRLILFSRRFDIESKEPLARW